MLDTNPRVRLHQLFTGRIEQIVTGLRTFSRSDDEKLVKFSLSNTIEDTLGLVEQIYLKENIFISSQYSGDIEDYNVFGHAGRIQQVLMNLLSNSKDALFLLSHSVGHFFQAFFVKNIDFSTVNIDEVFTFKVG